MAQPEQSSGDPSPDADANIIDFREATRNHARHTDVAIEHFLLSDEGRAEMGDVYETVDTSDRIIGALFDKFLDSLQDMQADRDPSIYAHFLHDDGAEALTRLELIPLYDANPLISHTMRMGARKRYDGDYQAQQVYTLALRVFMNMVRYEWLTRTYDGDDPRWMDRAQRLGDFHGSELHLNLQPGTKRTVIIPRRNSPSDYLENIQD